MRRSRSSYSHLIAVAVLCLLPLLASCAKKSTPGDPGGPTDPTGAAKLVLEANQQLEDILFAQINSTTGLKRPADIDLHTPESKYNQALALDAANADAHFGVAVLGLMSLTYDPEVNAAFDEWNTYLQSHVPFQTGSAPTRPLGVPTTLSGGLSGLRLPYELVPFSMVASLRASQTAVDPQISRAQNILSQRVIPRLQVAIAHLGVVAAHTGYVFTITPRMQGETSLPPILVHTTDVLALRAASELLIAACDLATAYNLGFATYDSLGLVNAFKPGSGWLALAGTSGTSGRDRMRDARVQALTSILDAKAVIATLLAQTGNHDNDLIKIPPGPRGRTDADSLNAGLDRASQALQSGYTLTADWDGNSSTPDVALQIRVDLLFTDPVPDWKALLPTYTASAVPRPYDETSESFTGGIVCSSGRRPGKLLVEPPVRVQYRRGGTADSEPEPVLVVVA